MRRIVTNEQACQEVGVSRRTVYNWLATGKVAFCRTAGGAVRIYPKTPGHHLLVDRDRKYAVVDVWAFLHPLHASSALTGYYRIDGLPVGKVKVQSTHPNIDGNAEADLTVSAGVVHKVDLVIKNTNRDAGAAQVPEAGAPPPLR